MGDVQRDRVDPILDHVRSYRDDVVDAAAVHIRLRRLAHRVETETRRRLAPQGLEFWEIPLLSGLIRNDGTLGIAVLQDIAQVTSGAITQRIAKMEEAGSVRRTFGLQDRRQVNVEITEAGRERFDRLARAMQEAEAAIYGDVDPALLASLARDLRVLMIAIEGPEPSED
ncbi:transcriptional regulator [Nocardioides sp.]|uniref:MarR family winged helix-turn-helix transcriptional regulator n=1 Tax=Nocardioides sp. TaxID=35761 RepID=UPI002607AB11|nr:transcriptional regulator [Nocardioides sp.]